MADSTRVQTEIQDNSRLPDLTKDAVKMKLVQKGYLYYTPMAIFGSIVVPAVLAFFISVVATDPSEFVSIILAIFNSLSFIILVVSALVLAFAFTIQYLTQPGNVYLVDFACHEPKANHRVTSEEFMRRSTLTGKFTPESIQFQTKILEKSGIGPTAFPAALVLKSPPELTMQGAREEFEDVVYPCIEALLSRNNLRARDIDILVVNCSLFCPTPSLSAMIVNKFKMRSNIVAYNLGGMGCSASVIAVDLAKRLLQGCPKSRAIVVSTENITQNWYLGNNRPMLVTNTLFREGGAAMLLSNHPADKGHAMFKLLHTVRTHKGADDDNFKCVYQEEDENGITGVSLSKTVMKVAGDALKSNITTLGPLTLPLTEQIFVRFNSKLLAFPSMYSYVRCFP